MIAVVLILATPFSTIQIEQRIFRHRAERLLADIQDIQLRQSSWSDAQKLQGTWGKWGDYRGPCGYTSCNYEIKLSDSIAPRLTGLSESFLARPVWDAYFFLGGRAPEIWAKFSVTDGIIWSKEIHAVVSVPSNFREAISGQEGYEIATKVVSRGKLGSEANISSRQFVDHPDYVFSGPGGCTFCIAGWMHFTPYTSPEIVQRLMALDLSCFTRLLPCRKVADLAPAWAEQAANDDFKPGLFCAVPAYAMGRESGTAVSATVVSQMTQYDPQSRASLPAISIQVDEVLKGSQSWQKGTVHTLFNYANLAAPMPAVGSRYVVFLDESVFNTSDPPGLEPCHLLPYTDASRSDVLRGVDQDKAFLPQGYEPFM